MVPGATVPGAGLDVSEGGLRCRLRRPDPDNQREPTSPYSGRRPALDGRLTVRFTLDGEEFTVRGLVVRTIPLEDGGREIGIRFVEMTAAVADRLRRVVFALERRQRASGVLG